MNAPLPRNRIDCFEATWRPGGGSNVIQRTVSANEAWEIWKHGNNKIQLIKFVREVNDMGLKDAKEFVEQMWYANMGAERQEHAFQQFWDALCVNANAMPAITRDLTDDEFIDYIKDVLKVDPAIMMYEDKCDVVLAMLNNMKAQGGSREKAREIDYVLGSL